MLDKAGSAKGRADLGAKTGIGAALILEWTKHVDLMRLSGVRPHHAELLEAAGLDTVKELAQRNAANLVTKLAELNTRERLAGTSPAVSEIARWIGQAKKLDPKIFY